MKLVFLCLAFSATLASLNAASIQQTEKTEDEAQAAKKQLLVNKLRELLKTATSEGKKREAAEVKTDTTANVAKLRKLGSLRAKAGQPNGRGVPTNRRGMTRRRHPNPAPVNGQKRQEGGKVTQLLQRRMHTLGARQRTNANAQLKQNRRGLLNRKYGARATDIAKAKRAPNKRLRTSDKRSQTLNKRYDYSDCDNCYNIMNGYSEDYNNELQYCSDTYGDMSYGMYYCDMYMDIDYDPYGYLTCEYCYTILNDEFTYDYGEEWYNCSYIYGDMYGLDVNYYCYGDMYGSGCDHDYGSAYNYNMSCETPCEYELGNDFLLCFLTEVYTTMDELQDRANYMYPYDSDTNYMYPYDSDNLGCKLQNLLAGLSYELSVNIPNDGSYNDPAFYKK